MILAVKNLGESVGKRLERKQKMWSLKWERQGNNTGMSKVILKMKKCAPIQRVMQTRYHRLVNFLMPQTRQDPTV
jgi:hypothetical protein